MNFKPVLTKNDRKTGDFEYESIKKYMAKKLITFSPEQKINEVIDIMVKNKISGAPVLNSKKELVGVISERDCLRPLIDKAYNNQPIRETEVKDLMSKEVVTVSDEKDIVDLAHEFLKANFKRFPVVNSEGKLVGQISRRDILRAIQDIEPTTW